MSRENVEIVRRSFENYELQGVQLTSELVSDDLIFNPADEAPQHGLDEAVAYMKRWEGEWEDLKTVPEEFVDAGDSVLVVVYFSGRGRESGIKVDMRLYEVFTVRDGCIVRWDEFTDRAEALEAVGLPD